MTNEDSLPDFEASTGKPDPWALYVVADDLVDDPEAGNLVETYSTQSEARKAQARKSNAQDLLLKDYEVRPLPVVAKLGDESETSDVDPGKYPYKCWHCGAGVTRRGMSRHPVHDHDAVEGAGYERYNAPHCPRCARKYHGWQCDTCGEHHRFQDEALQCCSTGPGML